MSISPVLFPDIEGPEFVESSEVGEVADAILDRHGRAGGIGSVRRVRTALLEEQIRAVYLLNTKPFDPMKDDVKHDAIAKVVKAPRLWHDVTGIDLVVWVRAYFWDQFDDRQRSGVILHELLHVDVAIDEKTGDVKVGLLEHDVEEFILAVRHYGAFIPSREALVKAYGLWQQDGGKPAQPEPVPSFTERVLDHVVDEVNAGAMGPNVTATRGPRNVVKRTP
jgi:hypothetical protein